MSQWRTNKPCEDCPFNDDGPGFRLRKSLARGRWASILASLRRDIHFTCHKTTTETGNGTNLICAGALNWLHARGLSSNFERVCESIEYFSKRRAAEGTREGKTPR